MSLESTALSAGKGTKSLRGTIPKGIVVYLELEKSNKLEWKMEYIRGGRRVAVVKKMKKK